MSCTTMTSDRPHPARSTVLIAASLLALSFAPAPVAESVTVAWLNDLSFGDVAAGANHSVPYTDVDAAAFQLTVSGMAGFQNVALSFSLPTHIRNGADTLPITFSASDAAWNYSNDKSGATSFDPATGAAVPKLGNNFSIYVWVGASINPGGATPTTLYSETLTLTAEIQ